MNDLKPCPFCGHKPPPDLIDTLYQSGSYWKSNPDIGRAYGGHEWADDPDANACYVMHCKVSAGGCGAQIRGDSEEEVLAAWERRARASDASANPPAQAPTVERASADSVGHGSAATVEGLMDLVALYAKTYCDTVINEDSGHDTATRWEAITAYASHFAALQADAPKPEDKGPWSVADWDSGVHLASDDFEHDVSLRIAGDFGGKEQKLAYANMLCARLNAAGGEVRALTDEQIVEEADNIGFSTSSLAQLLRFARAIEAEVNEARKVEVRMLTEDEWRDAIHPTYGLKRGAEAIQRKFCEVNGLRLSQLIKGG